MTEIIRISDLNAAGIAPYAHLNETQLKHYFEPDGGIFIAEAPTSIIRALDAGYEPLSMLCEERFLGTEAAEILRRFEALSDCIPVYTSDIGTLSEITGYHLNRGILAAMRRRPLRTVEEIAGGAKRIAVLEDVENPTNVGAIMRSAAALGMDALLLTDTCADPLYRRAIRVSVGTVFQIPWTYFSADVTEDTEHVRGRKFTGAAPNGPQAEHIWNGRPAAANALQWPADGIERLHDLGFRVAAMALRRDTVSIADPCLAQEEKLALILGNEWQGIRDETLDLCDYTVKIPMTHGVDSLNVAAASAVAFWQFAGVGQSS